MSKREDTDPELLMTLAIAEKESMVLLNLDLTPIKSSPKRTKLSPDHTVEFCAEAALNQESSEPSSSKKSRPSRKLNRSPKSNDNSVPSSR
jgi:hypothetical protein